MTRLLQKRADNLFTECFDENQYSNETIDSSTRSLSGTSTTTPSPPGIATTTSPLSLIATTTPPPSRTSTTRPSLPRRVTATPSLIGRATKTPSLFGRATTTPTPPGEMSVEGYLIIVLTSLLLEHPLVTSYSVMARLLLFMVSVLFLWQQINVMSNPAPIVGGDGSVYEGRGWEVVGAHSLHFNNYSIGICLIGDWTAKCFPDTLPPAKQLQSAKSLISAGVDKGYINVDYKLVGHRQVRETECPGDALFREIQKWKYFSNFPASKSDLIHVKEIPKHIREQWKKKGL
ncbi:unnamed protein product [Leptidea sinapis]|uniref:Peptidoglycan recognition protein family domain-containing protein n=1 Tax=Leptidea sinapis TaxID=189913 RepID=A0A5E4PTT1_9NEOP|nr:unnamed protein product [Leptidea sinapis]